ncbi:MAG: hypothetical protein U0531_11265 [Dehalococcoidia bacterium]
MYSTPLAVLTQLAGEVVRLRLERLGQCRRLGHARVDAGDLGDLFGRDAERIDGGAGATTAGQGALRRVRQTGPVPRLR